MLKQMVLIRRWLVSAACVMAACSSHAGERVRAPLLEVSRIRELDGSNPDAFGSLVRIRGTVTWQGDRGCVVEDDSAAVYVSIRQARRTGEWQGSDDLFESLAPGVEVEIEGTTQRAGYSPSLHPVDIRITGRRTLPPAPEFNPELFFTGFEEVRRIAAEVIVQAVRDDTNQWRFVVEHYGRQFTADIEKTRFSSDPRALIDAEVRMEGVAVALFNQRGEFIAPKLAMYDESDITVLTPPPASPFVGPKVPLARIGSYRPLPVKGHRVVTEGTVIHTAPGRFFYLQERAIGVRVETTQDTPLAVGDRVEVAGFLKRGEPAAGLIEACYRRLGRTDTPQPFEVEPSSLVSRLNRNLLDSLVIPPGDYEGCLVSFPARLLGMNPTADGGQLMLAADTATLNAWADGPTYAAMKSFAVGSLLQVTGVAAIQHVDKPDIRHQLELPVVGNVELFLRSADDVRILQPASWWTAGRLSLALGTVASLAALATIWAVMLRRQVRRQLTVIESQLQMAAATKERKRIAQEFHDTLEQDLAGIAMRLDVAAERARDDASRAVLESQRALLERLRSDTHDFLWDLRDPTRHDGSLRESLADQVAYAGSLGPVALRFQGNGVTAQVSPFVQHHLLRIVREAVANAVRHAAATTIDVALSFQGGAATVEVRDDGQGFDVTTRGSMPGHFGVRGMRERARRINATFTIESSAGTGTVVRVTAPTSYSDAAAKQRPSLKEPLCPEPR